MVNNYECPTCHWVYRHSEHQDTFFWDLPEDWKCPHCNTKQEDFIIHYDIDFDANLKLWTKITDDQNTRPTEDDNGEYCFIHSIHNDVCFRVLWQYERGCWVEDYPYNDEEWYPGKDVDMWMLNPIPYPTRSSKYASD